MKFEDNTKKRIKKGKLFTFFVITIFSLFICLDVNASNFNYSEFNWDKFYESRKDFWEEACKDENDNIDSTCNYKILTAQKNFYTKFYKTLAKYEKKGLYINDNVILETVFYEMSPSQFSDNGKEYLDYYYQTDSDKSNKKGLYIIDENDLDDPNIEDDYSNQDAATYFQEERDTIKTLVKNMIANSTSCYGIYGNPTIHTQSDGSTYSSCDSGGKVINIKGYGIKCADVLQAKNEMGFWEYFVSKWSGSSSLQVSFLNNKTKDENYEACKSISGYAGGTAYIYNDKEEVSLNRYFDFLSYNKYFDGKIHLQSHFKDNILDPAGVDCLTSNVCENSLEAKGLYEEYEGELIKSRREIIQDIIDILNNYGYEISYDPLAQNAYNETINSGAQRKNFYWPIGSDEIEDRNGIIYADGNPTSTEILSYFGARTNTVTGEAENNYGIDIAGTDGVTNVIGVYRGEVIAVVNSCNVGDYNCNDGYGNMVILAHSNGDYTVYAHLSSIDSSITLGVSVDKGQLIGKVGKTGRTNIPCLHFELRKGGNSVEYASNPSNDFNPENPRPEVAAGDFAVHETSLSKEEFASKLRSYCNNYKCSNVFHNQFVMNAEYLYDISISNNVNPELVVIRGAKEGMSPGGDTYNYWGIACYNGAGASACSRYSDLASGIAGFAKVVKNYETVSQMMSRYAYIGRYWYNPGSWSDGGCKYFPYIREYMSDERASYVQSVCGGLSCSTSDNTSCTPTNEEDQTAYTLYNIRGMVDMRYVAFGL